MHGKSKLMEKNIMKKDKDFEVYSTIDYGKFKILSKRNRIIRKGHVKQLIKSITKKNLLQDFPIVVSKDFYILDGQHRYLAAKEMGIPIWYVITNQMLIDDISLVNTGQVNWSPTDYLKKYVDERNKNYIEFENILKKNHDILKINTFLTIISLVYNDVFLNFRGAHAPDWNRTNLSVLFKSGEFEMPDKKSLIEDMILKIRDFSDYVVISCDFVKAVLILLQIKGYNHNRMLSKLSQKNVLKANLRTQDYFPLFNEVYNYNTTNTLYLRCQNLTKIVYNKRAA